MSQCALLTGLVLLLTGCESTRTARDYDAPIKRQLARGGDAIVELLIEVDRDGKATILDVTGVSPGTRASDIDITYDLVALTTYPRPRPPADSYQSKTLMNLARIAGKGDNLLANPTEDRQLQQYQERQFMERQLTTRTPRSLLGPDHTANN
ncbi:MAG: hypothetical protein ACFE0O_04755 [Opitutales bacterium]